MDTCQWCQYLSDLNVYVVKHEESWSNDKNDFLRTSKRWKRNLCLPQWRGDEDSVCGSKTRRHVGESETQIKFCCCRVNSFHFHIIARFCIDFGNAIFSVYTVYLPYLYFPSSLEDGKHYTQVSGKWVFLWGKSKHSMWVIYSKVKLLSPSLWWEHMMTHTHCAAVWSSPL